MTTEIVFVKNLRDDLDPGDFFRRVTSAPEINKDFLVCRMEATAIKDVLRDWITTHGISSLFNYNVTCDAVMHPGITVDEIEKLILGFVRTLQGVKHLFIIDPYFYTSEPAVLKLFERMMWEVSKTLERVTFFSRRRLPDQRIPMHAVLSKLMPGIKIHDVETDEFHDRFWIDPDKQKGLVMGTSLNGVTKKIALIDHLGRADAAQLASMAKSLI